VEQAYLLEHAGPRERPHIDRSHPSGLDQASDLGLGPGVVAGYEHLQGLPRRFTRDQRLGEGRIERLYHGRAAGHALGRLLRRRASFRSDDAVHAGPFERVGDVDDDSAGQRPLMLLDSGGNLLVGQCQYDDLTVHLAADGRLRPTPSNTAPHTSADALMRRSLPANHPD
jgi:hypothetical protein